MNKGGTLPGAYRRPNSRDRGRRSRSRSRSRDRSALRRGGKPSYSLQQRLGQRRDVRSRSKSKDRRRSSPRQRFRYRQSRSPDRRDRRPSRSPARQPPRDRQSRSPEKRDRHRDPPSQKSAHPTDRKGTPKREEKRVEPMMLRKSRSKDRLGEGRSSTDPMPLSQRFAKQESDRNCPSSPPAMNRRSLIRQAEEISIVIERILPPDEIARGDGTLILIFDPMVHRLYLPRRPGEGSKCVFDREEITRFGHDLAEATSYPERRRIVRVPGTREEEDMAGRQMLEHHREPEVHRQLRPITEYEDKLGHYARRDVFAGDQARHFSSDRDRGWNRREGIADRYYDERPPMEQRPLPEFSKRPDKGRVPVELLNPVETPRDSKYFLHDDRENENYSGRFQSYRGRGNRGRAFGQRGRFNFRNQGNRYGDRDRDAPRNRSDQYQDRGRNQRPRRPSPEIPWSHDKFEELEQEEPSSSTDKKEQTDVKK